MADSINPGNPSQGVYPIITRGQLLNFIISEKSSPTRRTRKEIAVTKGQTIGGFVDTDGKPVTVKTAADASKIAGVCLTEPSSMHPDLTANWLDLKATMIAPSGDAYAELKSTVLTANGFKGVQFIGGKFTCTGQDGITGTGALTTAQANLDAVIAQLQTLNIILVVTGL